MVDVPNRQDSSGPYTDPTHNVLLLVEAAVKRLDDLYNEGFRRLDETLMIHLNYIDKLNVAESKRIDAIRAVDVAAVAIASERASQQAIVLANQVSASAETLRSLVASTASTVASQLQQVSARLEERLALLEKAQYEGKGLSGVPPQLLNRIDTLEKTGYQSAGKGEGIAKFAGWIFAGITIIIAIATYISIVTP